MSSEEYISGSLASSHHSETRTTSSGEEIPADQTSDGLEADLAQIEDDTGSSGQLTRNQREAGSSSRGAAAQSSAIDLDSYTRGAWMGSDLTQA
jgi:hypothetical protein